MILYENILLTYFYIALLSKFKVCLEWCTSNIHYLCQRRGLLILKYSLPLTSRAKLTYFCFFRRLKSHKNVTKGTLYKWSNYTNSLEHYMDIQPLWWARTSYVLHWFESVVHTVLYWLYGPHSVGYFCLVLIVLDRLCGPYSIRLNLWFMLC